MVANFGDLEVFGYREKEAVPTRRIMGGRLWSHNDIVPSAGSGFWEGMRAG